VAEAFVRLKLYVFKAFKAASMSSWDHVFGPPHTIGVIAHIHVIHDVHHFRIVARIRLVHFHLDGRHHYNNFGCGPSTIDPSCMMLIHFNAIIFVISVIVGNPILVGTMDYWGSNFGESVDVAAAIVVVVAFVVVTLVVVVVQMVTMSDATWPDCLNAVTSDPNGGCDADDGVVADDVDSQHLIDLKSVAFQI
jgi:hypothetical protein